MDSKTQEQVKRQATLRPAVSKQLSGNVPGARAPEVKTGHGPTARGFEPLRAEPNGFLVRHLNHSVTLSCAARNKTEMFNNVSGVLILSLLGQESWQHPEVFPGGPPPQY